jgi:hypothetical protein
LLALPGSSHEIEGLHLRWIDIERNTIVSGKDYESNGSFENLLAIQSLKYRDRCHVYWTTSDPISNGVSLHALQCGMDGKVFAEPHQIAWEQSTPGQFWIWPRVSRTGSFANIVWGVVKNLNDPSTYTVKSYHHLLPDSLTGNDVTEGQNRFFIAPLIERSYDVSAKIVK